MLEYQGWASIREAFNEADEDERQLGDAITHLNNLIEEIDAFFNVHILFKSFNGYPRLVVMGGSNRKDGRWDAVLKLFEEIRRCAPVSYGVLSFWDDEDQSDNYHSYVLKKGTLKLHRDLFLGLCFNEIEES